MLPVTAATSTRGRGRPAKISRAAIVEAALELGLGTFSMQELAAHLGVTAPALYAHVAGRDEIVELVADALRGKLLSFSSVAPHWRGWLEDFAAHVRRHLGRSAPAVLAGLRHRGASSNVGIGEAGLRMLIDEGLSATEAGYAMWLVFRVSMTAGPEDTTPFAGFVDDTGTVLATSARSDLPSTEAVHHALVSDGPHDTFAFDLAIVLDGIAARLDRIRAST